MDIDKDNKHTAIIREWLRNKNGEEGIMITDHFKIQMSHFNDIVAELIYEYCKTIQDRVVNKATAAYINSGRAYPKHESVDCMTSIRIWAELNGYKLPDDWPFDEENRINATPSQSVASGEGE